MLHTKMLQERLKESGSKVVAVSPGLVRTNIFSSDKNSSDTTMARIAYYLHTIFYPFIWTFSKNEIEGAQTTLYCVYEDFAKLEGGAYYHDCSLREASTLANDRGLAK
jgi:NAD(P)-dependent dehydrogenase (short-subunit alcohol dehydrogenase family)